MLPAEHHQGDAKWILDEKANHKYLVPCRPSTGVHKTLANSRSRVHKLANREAVDILNQPNFNLQYFSGHVTCYLPMFSLARGHNSE